jgi:peptide/nickel transport system ATP-binding protein
VSRPALIIRGLRVRFPALGYAIQAVRGCDLALGEGELLGLVGESGCGKSVTALACLGLVPPPGEVTGSIEVHGREVVGRTDAELADVRGGVVAMIFQNPSTALNPFFTVGRQLADAVARHRHLDRRAAHAAAVEALDAVKLPDPVLQLEKYPHQMSGGQLQRVMIAMAIACRPRVLIADEPTTALDVTVQAQIIVLLRDLARTRGLSVLFITHDLGVVAALCDRVAVMYAGLVVEEAPVHSLYAAPAHPYTLKLLETVPRLGREDTELEAIRGQVPNLASPPPGCAFHPRCDRATEVCALQVPGVRMLGAHHLAACHHAPGQLRLDERAAREVG